MTGSLLGAGIMTAGNFLGSWYNNSRQAEQTDWDRQENYRFGEMAAENAYQRQIALYQNLYSPEALMKQYKAAGLSPSMMFGGTPGQGGTAAPQGNGAAGPQTPYMPASLLEAAQAAQLFAQTEKTKAETKNVESDTNIKRLQETWQDMMNKEKSIEFDLTTSYLTSEDGKPTSLFELAQNCYDYEKFMEAARNAAKRTGADRITLQLGTEAGQKTMRQIYMNANRFERDIKTLSYEGVNADFQQRILQEMGKKGFAEQNASTALEQLRAIEETAKLTVEQKNAWNNVIERLQRTNSTMADIIIVLSMIFNNAASNWDPKFIKK